MLNQIRSFMIWLHKPDHVARFQRYFGILPASMPSTDLTKSNCDKTHTKQSQNQNVNSTEESRPIINGFKRTHHQRKVTYDTNVLDECIKEIEHSSNQNPPKKAVVPENDYRITVWFWYYFFQFGSSIGNEIFYIVFFPTWVWNVDGCLARKISSVWLVSMYIGQVTKDILCMPRPAPPAIQLEKRYFQEYGFPSTHAMFAASIPLTSVLLTYQRYDFNIWIGLACAFLTWLWVCSGRIYLGMHTFLDIIGGTIFSLILLYIIFPYINVIDDFQVNYMFSPIITFCLGILLLKCYPSVKQWSTARSDTAVIIGSTVGLMAAGTAMKAIGLLKRSPAVRVALVNRPDIPLCCLRTFIGLLIIYATRQIVKTIILRVTSVIYGLNWKDPEIKRLAKVELPYYYLTYLVIGFNIAFTVPLTFRAIGIVS